MFTLLSKSSPPSKILENGFLLYRYVLTRSFLLSLCTTLFFLLPLYWPYFQGEVLLHPFLNSTTYKLATVLCFFFSFLGLASLNFYLHCQYYQIPCSYIQAIQQGLSRLISLTLVASLYAIIVLAGTALLIVPGFLLSISLMFAFFLVVHENKNVFQSLIGSHQLVWSHWWHSFITVSMPILVNLLVLLLIFIILGSIFSNLKVEPPILAISFFGAHVFFQSLLTLLTISVALPLFNDLRIRQRQTQRQTQSPF